MGTPERYEKCYRISLVLFGISPLLLLITILFRLFFLLLLLAIPVVLLLYSYYPIYRLKAHYSRLEDESIWGVFASTVYAYSGIHPLKIFIILGNKEYIFPSLSFEVNRIIRDSRIKMIPLLEVLKDEYMKARGFWRMFLGTVITLETTGGDVTTYFRDLYKDAVNELRIKFRNQAREMTGVSSAVTIFLAILPASLIIMLVILASSMVLSIAPIIILLDLVVGLMIGLVADSFSPRILSYSNVYKRIIAKYLPIGVSIGVSSYLGIIRAPLTLKFNLVISIISGVLSFSIPAYIEFRRHSRAIDNMLDMLPIFIRDLADEIKRGISPVDAISKIIEVRSYNKYVDKLLRLLLNKINLQGLRKALNDLKPYLPRQFFFALDVIGDADEIGARAEVFDVLADIMHDWIESLKEYKGAVRLGRYTALLSIVSALGIVIFLFGSIVRKIALAGDMIRRASSSLYGIPISIDIATTSMIPLLKSLTFTIIEIAGIVLAFTSAKSSSFRFGDGFRDSIIISSMILVLLIIASFTGMI